MRLSPVLLTTALILLLVGMRDVSAQRGAAAESVPRLVSFAGSALDAAGRPRTGTVRITFSLYGDPEYGAPIWQETQRVAVNGGRYEALLGAASPDGLPMDLFTSGEARWLGVRIENEREQRPRVMLLSVPYALKAQDSDRLGGRPVSDFALAAEDGGGGDGGGGGSANSAPKGAQSFTASSAPGFISLATEGPPLSVNSTGVVNWLNADLLDGEHAADLKAHAQALVDEEAAKRAGADEAEAAARKAADEQEASERKAADAAETSARQAAIEAEQAARANADGVLQKGLDGEAITRAAADADLHKAISGAAADFDAKLTKAALDLTNKTDGVDAKYKQRTDDLDAKITNEKGFLEKKIFDEKSALKQELEGKLSADKTTLEQKILSEKTALKDLLEAQLMSQKALLEQQIAQEKTSVKGDFESTLQQKESSLKTDYETKIATKEQALKKDYETLVGAKEEALKKDYQGLVSLKEQLLRGDLSLVDAKYQKKTADIESSLTMLQLLQQATAGGLDAHKTSMDHDGRYVRKGPRALARATDAVSAQDGVIPGLQATVNAAEEAVFYLKVTIEEILVSSYNAAGSVDLYVDGQLLQSKTLGFSQVAADDPRGRLAGFALHFSGILDPGDHTIEVRWRTNDPAALLSIADGRERKLSAMAFVP